MGSTHVSLVALAVALAVAPLDADGQTRPRRVDAELAPTTTDGSAAPSDKDVVRLDGDLVEVPVVVADRSGRYVAGLLRDDFRVFEDGVPQEITTFIPERVPFHVAIVIDTSESTRGSIVDIQDAAIALIDQLGPQDSAVVVAFSDRAVLKTREFTNDKRVLKSAVRDTHPGGRTRLYDSVYATVTRCLPGVSGRKAVVILSDGHDTASNVVSFDQAVRVFNETDAVVYGVRYPELTDYASGTVTIYDPSTIVPFAQVPRAAVPQRQSGGRLVMRPGDYDPYMEDVARASGGTVYYADAVTDMPALCEAIAEELRHVYTLGYQPTNPMANGGRREIAVVVPRLADAAVRYRLAYTP